LNAIAGAQHGLFTSKQATVTGFSRSTHTYHVRAGNWVREHRGIYRLAAFPRGEQADLALGQLWSTDREDRVHGVYSHETALDLHQCSNWKAAKLHMTVPQDFRRSGKAPEILRLHFADLAERDIMTRPGLAYTGPLRTILDLLAANTLPRHVLRAALLQMIERGMIDRQDLKQAKIPAESRRQFDQLAKAMGKR